MFTLLPLPPVVFAPGLVALSATNTHRAFTSVRLAVPLRVAARGRTAATVGAWLAAAVMRWRVSTTTSVESSVSESKEPGSGKYVHNIIYHLRLWLRRV